MGLRMYTRTGPVQKHTGAPTVARARICAHECKQGTPKRRHNGTLEHRGIGTRMIPRGGLRTFFFDVFGATKRGFRTCRGVTPVHPFRHFPAHYHKKKYYFCVSARENGKFLVRGLFVR